MGAKMNHEIKNSLLKEIIEEELEHFLRVEGRDGKASCQEHPETFRIMRTMNFGVHNVDFLQSYLEDLKEAKNDKRNLLKEKYALMENLLERLNFDEHIEKILDIECEQQEEVHRKYPELFASHSPAHFRNYLSCELQTFSPNTLRHYYENIILLQKEGKNIIEERYQILMKLLNKPPLGK